MAELTIHGARGSLPVSGADVSRFGGHTTSMSASLFDGSVLVVDTGTGVTAVHGGASEYHLVFTHYHLDHLIGLPFFDPLYDPDVMLTFYGFPWGDLGVEEAISGPYAEPWFPISIADTPSQKRFVDLSGEEFSIGEIGISVARLRHPQDVTAYRLDGPQASVTIATDYEADGIDHRLVELARDADVLVHDSQYTPEDYADHEGWGHSTWVDAVEVAAAAGVDQLILTSHAPNRTDAQIDAYVTQARERFEATDAAYEGLTVPL
ncbi:MAG: MBL fold metallo-hydrolase [Acidimicrobiia bacterium]|nr:MBL fold metallo-hydrolase [Acidimicrobiia bacterium]